MLRTRTFLFVGIVLAALLALPALNVARSLQAGRAPSWTPGALLNTGAPASWRNYVLYRAGISASPAEVVVGREGWLYLGDKYEGTLTASQRGQTAADVDKAIRIGAAARAWDAWMKQHGVKLYRVLVGPNKTSVYPEYLPRWARPAASAPMDALVSRAAPWYVDPRPALLHAKSGGAELLYFRTDTHWTQLGAAVAFQAFAEAVAPHAPDIRWPQERSMRLQAVGPRHEGDLTGLLRLNHWLADVEPQVGVTSEPLHTTEHDYLTGRLLREGQNAAIQDPKRTLLVTSRGALNQRKVLWLRDSFGSDLAPLMAATFSETLQLHWNRALAQPADLAQLIAAWRPDYVFVTVVERDALTGPFMNPPPSGAGRF
jgi:hypothetical protein